MVSHSRCSVVFFMQLLCFALMSLYLCDCFQIETISTTKNCVGYQKNGGLARFQPSPTTKSPREETCMFSSLTSYLNSVGGFEGDDEDSETPSVEHTVTLHYENRSCDIRARADETILTALERNQGSLERLGLPNSIIPSDCRRGNCLTCTGTHASVSSRLASGTAVVCDGDGLSPHMSRTIQEKGYILTCSTRVVGEGLQLNLGQNHEIWKDMYQDRLEREPTQDEKWAAMARSKRRTDERNKARWKNNMEELVQEETGGGEADAIK